MKLGALCICALVAGCGEPAAPSLTFTEASIHFPDTVIDHGVDQTIVLTNTGNADASASFAFADDADFTFKSTSCHQVAPGASCNLVVAFEPHSLGPHMVELTAKVDDVSVSTSLVGVAVAEPGLRADANVDFGGVLIGTPKTMQVTVVNGSNATARAYSVALAGTDAADFTITDDKCINTAPSPRAPCTIDVTFTPSQRASRNAQLVVTSDNLGSVTIELTGHGDSPAQLAVSPDSGMFGSVFVLGASPPHTFTVTNTGDVESQIVQLYRSGVNELNFTLTDGCSGSALAGGASCTFSIVYHAQTLATHEAAVTVTAYSLDPIVVPLTGTGKPGLISITPPDWSFGQVVAGETSVAKTFTIENTGSTNTGPLAVALGGLQASLTFDVGADACTGVDLAPGGTCTVAVAASPVGRGGRNHTLLVGGTRGDTGVANLYVEGLLPAMLSTTAVNGVAFGDVPMTQNPSLFMIIDNYGDLATGTMAVAITGPDRADITLVNETCTGNSLQTSATCSMTVSFSPSHLGNETAAIEITSPGATLTIPVTANTIP